MIARVTVPVVATLVAVSESVADCPATLAGVNVAASPLDIPDTARATIPAKPPVRLTEIVLVVDEPCDTVIAAGLVESEKPPVGGAATTVRVNEPLTLVTPAPLAVTVSVYAPGGTDAPTSTVITLVVTVAATWGVEIETTAPPGAPVTETVAGPTNPLVPVTRAVVEVDAPCATLPAVGVNARLIVGVGPVVPPVESLPDPHPMIARAKAAMIAAPARRCVGVRTSQDGRG